MYTIRPFAMHVVAVVLSALCSGAHARDIWTPYDGPTGISCARFNDAATLPWRTKGGDIGPAVETIKQALTVGALNRLDVTSVMRAEGFAVKGNRIFDVSSKEGAAPPRLIVTLPDTTIALDPIADVGISCSTTSPTGTSKVLKMGSGPVAFFFPPVPVNATAAHLEFTPAKAYSGAAIPTWTLHEVMIPRSPVPEPRLDGIASQFVDDAGIGAHPSVLWASGLEPGDPADTECPLSQPARAGFQPAKGNAWENVIKGQAEGSKGTFEKCDLGERYFNGATYEFVTPNSEFPELFLRLEIRFGSDYRDLVGDLGGKLPLGVASGYRQPGTYRDYCGNGGLSCASGDRGWTARGGYSVISDKGNPAYPMVSGHQYIYHYQQPDLYGTWLSWGPQGLFELDRWYTLEMQIRVNTPGQADGILRVWIDGRPAIDRTNMAFRGPTTIAEIAAKGGQQWIRAYWLTWFHGGKKSPSHTMTGWVDNVVVATEYIGPRRTTAPETVTFPGPIVCRVGQQPVCQ